MYEKEILAIAFSG